MTDKLKVGIIGLGGIGKWHVPGWQASEHAELAAGCDINEAVFAGWADEHDVDKLTTNSADLFNDPDIDIIDICTPNNYHTDLTIAALEAGKHVMCEKPLAPTPADIRRMIAARDKSGKMLMTAQHHRFSGVSRAMKAEIDAGALGHIYHSRSWMLRRAAVPLRPSFIRMEQSGGGPTVDIGVHILDLTLWFMGNPQPVVVSGVARRELASQEGAFSIWGGDIPPEFDVEDFAAAFIRFENGASLILEVSWMLHHDTNGKYEDLQMWLYGTRGGAHWPKCEIYETNNATRQHYNRLLQRTQDQLKPHHQECVEFAQAIVDGAPSPVPAEQSLQVALILDGIYKSQKTGREVEIKT